MKYLGISGGWIIDEFCIFPSINIIWMRTKEGKCYDIQFAWFFWYFTVGQIKKKLKEYGY